MVCEEFQSPNAHASKALLASNELPVLVKYFNKSCGFEESVSSK